MQRWALVVMALGLSGCMAEDPKVRLVDEFWQAFLAADQERLKPLLTKPDDAQFVEGLRLEADQIKVLKATEQGADVRFSRHCYPDQVLPTVVVGDKVDLNATFKAHMRAYSPQQPTQKYCYDFKDQPMQGMLDGKPWQAQFLHQEEMDFGSRKVKKFSLVAEPCERHGCFNLKSPSLLLSQLDLTGEGGNFDHEHNITLYIPPSTNHIITQGSYRVTHAPGVRKVELSFKLDEHNYVNGALNW